MGTWTIGKKLFSALGALIAIAAVVGLYGLQTLTQFHQEISALNDLDLPRLEIAADINLELAQMASEIRTGIIMSTRKDGALVEESIRRHEEMEKVAFAKIAEFRTLSENGGKQDELGHKLVAMYEECEKALRAREAILDEVNRLALAFRAEEAARRLDDAKVHLVRANEIATEAHRLMSDEIAEGKKSMNVLYANARVWQLGLLVLALLCVVGIVVTVRGVIRELRDVSIGLKEGANQVAAASAQVSSSSQSLAQGASEQAASIEQTSAAMEEMAAMTRKNAENAQNAAVLMGEAERQVNASNTALHEMVTSMTSIQESSNKVAKIIKTIDEIAFQTNILALNAAVEAARAGEAGMGFAVVADEVRNLAQRSAQAARDTAGMIEESIDLSQEGSRRVEQVSAAIHSITASVTKVKEMVDEVSAASLQQTQGVDQVTQAVAQMEKVTQTSAATAEESAAASEELNAQAETTRTIATRLESMVTDARRGHTHGAAHAPATASPAPGAGVGQVLKFTGGRPVSESFKPTAEEQIPLGDTGTYGKF